MSLAELTRNSFQCGISASKWLALCKLLIAKTATINSSDTVASSISNSVLLLYRSYPGDSGLQDYLKAAIQNGILPVSTFVATLLQAARSPELHIPATLNTLCRIALDAHYSSGQPPIGSIVPFSESSVVTLATVHDALALLRTAHTLSISHFHQLTTSASELVVLLLSCLSDLSQLSTAQAMVYFNEVTFLLTHYRLSPDVRHMLDSFVISLTLLIGDDAKAAREAQLMQNLQFALGKGDISGPNSDGDMTTLGLILNTMVTYRAHEFGAGDITNAVALLVAGFRWSSWTPPVYYTQILLSAFSCLSQCTSTTGAKIWKAFIIGRLPILLASFTDTVNADKSLNVDLRGAFHTGLAAAFRRPDLILQGDHTLSRETTSDSPSNRDLPRSFSRELLQQLYKLNMVPQQVALQLDPLVFSEGLPKWYAEANDMGLELAVYLESKIMQDNNASDVQVWIDRIWKDVGSHSVFANIVLKRFSSPIPSLDVESFGHICKVLHTYEHAMEIVALHVRITDLLFHSLQFLEEYDCEIVGDPQTAFSHLGDVVLFVQYVLAKFKFENKDLVKNNRRVSPDFLINPDGVLSAQDRPQEDIVSFNAWFKALFDSNSEGIEDTILRSTKPKVLLRIAPALFSSAIQTTLIHKIDKDVLLNGVSYFTGPLLNWTLVGVIKSLTKDIQRAGFSAIMHLEILHSLVLSPSCPKPVLALCSPNIASLLYEKKRQPPIPASFNIAAVWQALADAIGMKGGSDPLTELDLSVGQISYQQVRQAVQTAFVTVRSHKSPYLDVRRCIKIVPPIKFLQLFWIELVASANLGELEACRRIATFVLTMPQDSTVCPLLPIFIHIVLPALVAGAGRQQPAEQAVTVELLVVTISSVLSAALHLEWAMRSVSGDDRLVLGQLSTAMARRLAQDLRRHRDRDVNSMILQRLASSQSFVANFPNFMSELNP